MRLSKWAFISFIFFYYSCTNSSEKKSSAPDSTSINANLKEKKFFSGTPDLPEDSFTVTSAGIGPIVLGDSLSKLTKVFEGHNPVISKLSMSEDGKEWPAIKIVIKDHYVIGESANTVERISVLRTNNPLYKTKNGIHVGMLLDSLVTMQDSLHSDVIHRTLMYGNSGVWFHIDSKSERSYFNKNKTNGLPKGAVIEELIIFCGDC